MKKLSLFIIFLLISNCSIKKVEKHHGVHFLDKKQQKLSLKSSNKNDLLNLLGPPSTKSSFDNDVWIYIERVTRNKSVLSLGKDELFINNVLVLEIDNKGLLVKKDFYDITKMNELKFSKKTTENQFSKNSFVYGFLQSMRQKINDPLNKRRK
jgi:outer membrane protein assembly factor BamE (lipoprotein component of BamABCDE complex)